MSSRNWNEERAKKRIDTKIDALPIKDIEIKEYVRDTDLTGLPNNVAYLVDGAHLYADILNMKDILGVTNTEGEICHKRTLRFLNLHYRCAEVMCELAQRSIAERNVAAARCGEQHLGKDARESGTRPRCRGCSIAISSTRRSPSGKPVLISLD